MTTTTWTRRRRTRTTTRCSDSSSKERGSAASITSQPPHRACLASMMTMMMLLPIALLLFAVLLEGQGLCVRQSRTPTSTAGLPLPSIGESLDVGGAGTDWVDLTRRSSNNGRLEGKKCCGAQASPLVCPDGVSWACKPLALGVAQAVLQQLKCLRCPLVRSLLLAGL